MKKILINATQPEEVRVAIVEGKELFNLDLEAAGKLRKKSNIYKGKITRVEPSLEAAFVDYGADRHGFLPLKSISREYFSKPFEPGQGRVSIKEVIKENQQIIVQVDKEERGNKGAALTTFISLAGRYLVLMPNNPRAGGISRKVEGDDRSKLREIMSQLEVPEDMGLIVRTAGIGKGMEELQWDLNYLLQLWEAIEGSAAANRAPILIHQESDIIVRSIRDYLGPDVTDILIDSKAAYDRAREFVEQVMPHNLSKLHLYDDPLPLFTRYQIENQIESVFNREVTLPSGGSIVIDHTEALTSIDVNSARATKGGDIEETALATNLEAADEIARQLRLRDLGGLFVVDFIDMTPMRNQREVETRLRDALKLDHARVQTGRISRFGLLEMSRQRLRPTITTSSQTVCPRCLGQGIIKDVESTSLSLLRTIEDEAAKPATARLIVQLPVEVATYLLNEKRRTIDALEDRLDIDIKLIPNQHMQSPDYKLERVRGSDAAASDDTSSYDLIDTPEQTSTAYSDPKKSAPAEPAVKNFIPSTPAPVPTVSPKSPEGVVKRLWSRLLGSFANDQAASEATAANEQAPRQATVPEDRNGDSEDAGGGRSGRGSSRSRRRGSRRQSSRGGDSQSSAKGDTQTTANSAEEQSNDSETNESRGKAQGDSNRRPRKKRTISSGSLEAEKRSSRSRPDSAESAADDANESQAADGAANGDAGEAPGSDGESAKPTRSRRRGPRRRKSAETRTEATGSQDDGGRNSDVPEGKANETRPEPVEKVAADQSAGKAESAVNARENTAPMATGPEPTPVVARQPAKESGAQASGKNEASPPASKPADREVPADKPAQQKPVEPTQPESPVVKQNATKEQSAPAAAQQTTQASGDADKQPDQ